MLSTVDNVRLRVGVFGLYAEEAFVWERFFTPEVGQAPWGPKMVHSTTIVHRKRKGGKIGSTARRGSSRRQARLVLPLPFFWLGGKRIAGAWIALFVWSMR